MKYLLILFSLCIFSCKIKTVPKPISCIKKDTVYLNKIVKDTITVDKVIIKDTIIYKEIVRYVDVYKYFRDTIKLTDTIYKEDLSKVIILNNEIQKLIYLNQDCNLSLTYEKSLNDSLRTEITKLKTQSNISKKTDWLYYFLLGLLITSVVFITIKLIQTYRINL